ncbi:hypothetical protein FN846DRAFT_936081 [Sphaerosporella brunnea]|uniref:Uncharacterized protein n=1 Tax=Sphaerosporella brunnea TaxID=1250544 RepID=A0A5J5F4M5_9PEZI|nr:hypothetical protein FN846DRAFT_936081 [Sphaerosporella brunnea]
MIGSVWSMMVTTPPPLSMFFFLFFFMLALRRHAERQPGLYDHLKSMNKRNLIPFSRWFKRRSARKYIIACKGWGRVRADHMEDADFIARATNGREGTVMVMWKRRFLFDPKNAEMQAGVY